MKDALEEMVLVRLGVKGLDWREAEEFVDAVDPCRSGLAVEIPRSVCARLKDEFDITLNRE
jgi:hypothetical protein